MALKRNGCIGTFKVVSRGRVDMNGGQGPLEVYQEDILTVVQKKRVDVELREQDDRRVAGEQALRDREDEMYMKKI